MSAGPVVVTVTFADEAQACAIAQLVKRLCWTEFRANAVDESEAYEIRAAVERFRTCLAEAGYAPR